MKIALTTIFGILLLQVSAFAKTTIMKKVDLAEVHVSVCESDIEDLKSKLDTFQGSAIDTLYFDSQRTDLLEEGLIIRVRKRDDGKHDLVVKVRDIDQEINVDGIHCEYDRYSHRMIESCKVKRTLDSSTVQNVFSGKLDVASLLTGEQRKLIRKRLKRDLDKIDLRPYGPVRIDRNKMADKLKTKKWRLEIWNYRGGEFIAEISYRVGLKELEKSLEKLEKFLDENDINRCSRDIRKTNYTLNYYK